MCRCKTRRWCCCCCGAKEELEQEKKTELSLETPLLEKQENPENVDTTPPTVPTEPRPEDKQRLKKIVKDFLKDAFEGIKIAYYDPNMKAIVSGVFRLDKRVKTATISATGSNDTLLSSMLSEWSEFKKVEEVTDDAYKPPMDIDYGLVFIPTAASSASPIFIQLADAEEQQRFFLSLSIAKHVGERSTPAT
eukprot:Blabericola_migrator_1__4450@NODE_2382_length_2849_cov_138_772466_g1492_i0_p2_GENE_NODE_2382_length_2849_cov_138_772466_g1492_i0NODE_2382_length_2849_cov_138_772466_g1492_i0_p2_ORF_typecomplete_len192_score36_78Shisa/PF13908_6/0_024FAM163/PF15069_6/1_7FAM163/PF15069_6/1_1e04_NODE_2382_length_2849_cov_138_772466_g1492_i0110685